VTRIYRFVIVQDQDGQYINIVS